MWSGGGGWVDDPFSGQDPTRSLVGLGSDLDQAWPGGLGRIRIGSGSGGTCQLQYL